MLSIKHKIAILRAGSGKSVVRKILLVVHAWVANPEGSRAPCDPLNPPLSATAATVYSWMPIGLALRYHS